MMANGEWRMAEGRAASRLSCIRLSTFALLLWAACAIAAAQSYPSRPVRLIVPYPPGGSTDFIARPVSERLTERLGQPFVMDNRGGAATVIGAEIAARAPADGYTLLVGTVTTLAVNPALKPKLPYDPVRDFAPVSMLSAQPYILAVNPSVPATSVAQLVAHAKANPGKLSFASAGLGSGAHFAGELFNHMAGVDILHIPYKGTGPAITDVIGGRVTILYAGVATLRSFVGSGKMRVLAVTSARRSPGMPDVPTIAESGLAGYETNTWNSLVAPRGTPRAVIERLNTAVAQVLSEPDLRERWTQQGIDAEPGPPEHLARHIEAEIARFARLVKATGLKLE
jgi:tripartite-type tricarboxylate transporter receptor subunit TctC